MSGIFVSLRYPFAYRVREWVPGVRSGNPGWVSVMGWAGVPYALSGEMTVHGFWVASDALRLFLIAMFSQQVAASGACVTSLP